MEIPVIEIVDLKTQYKKSLFYNIFKRGLDIISSLVGLILGIPFVILFGLLIKLEDKGPIIYKQERLGENGKKFLVYKLRSMKIDAEKIGGAQWAKKDDGKYGYSIKFYERKK